MSNARDGVDKVVKLMERMVAADGGSLTVRSFDADDSSLVVDYKKGQNVQCASCVLDDDSMRDFLVESFEAHGVKVGKVTVLS